ncbi:hypothetical protein J2793_006926 [Paraburkholderia caledonica]|uniref:Uncharacterized protein n=1 Tax=Paraburkholderia caledonica TaxID=134536 RepID=A0AB73INA8_9BURK|nr:hypothetical protein [Paraburkholderia caledonica]
MAGLRLSRLERRNAPSSALRLLVLWILSFIVIVVVANTGINPELLAVWKSAEHVREINCRSSMPVCTVFPKLASS